MTREEFFEWLNTCPTHKHNITFDEYDFVTVCFPITEEEEEPAPIVDVHEPDLGEWWSR